MNRTEILACFDEIARAKRWQPLHSPKNLAAAIAVEAAELLAEFTWRKEDETLDESASKRVANEIADVMMYLTVLAERLEIDMDQAIADKIAVNRERLLKSGKL